MKKFLISVAIAVLFAGAFFVYHRPELFSVTIVEEEDDQGPVDSVVARMWSNININSSTINILKESFKTKKDNTVISGLSLDFAVGMLANGVQGQSLEDLTNFFGSSVEEKNEELQKKSKNLPKTLEISNSIWGNAFRKPYKSLIEKTYNASAQPLPANTDVIDKWVKGKTHGKIEKLLGSKPTKPTNLYLINTVFFKDKWKAPFEKKDTERKTFHSLSGRDKKVQMMYKQDKIAYTENSKLESVKLPYKNGGYMIIFLPKEDVDFNEFISNLSVDDLNLKYYEMRDVTLYLPKFKIEQETNVRDLFEAMGIKEMFNPETVDLANISEIDNTYVEKIKQKAVVEVDESGTVAAAATAIVMDAGCAICEPPPPVKFVADRPFLFFITQGDFIGLYTEAAE